MFAEVLDRIPQPKTEPDECYLKDGLLYCRKCDTPKQTKISIFGTEKIVYCMCECETHAEKNMQLAVRSSMREEEIERARRMALDSPEFPTHTFANDSGIQPMIKHCQMYAREFETKAKNGSGLLIYGNCGTGKSYGAECIANYVIDRGKAALVTNFSKISEVVSAVPFEEKAAYFSSLRKYPLLVIDDLGVERETEYMMEIINRVIDERERSGKPMIITTNFSWEEICNPRNDDWARIFSRILKRNYPLRFEGDDLRKVEHMKMRKTEHEFYNSSIS